MSTQDTQMTIEDVFTPKDIETLKRGSSAHSAPTIQRAHATLEASSGASTKRKVADADEAEIEYSDAFDYILRETAELQDQLNEALSDMTTFEQKAVIKLKQVLDAFICTYNN